MENKYLVYIFITLALFMSIVMSLGLVELKRTNDRLDRANVEYQFVVEDRDIIVYDGNRLVGRVKLQGQLDSLLVDDNQ